MNNGVRSVDIWLSCEDPEILQDVAAPWGINFHHRNPRRARDGADPEIFPNLAYEIPGDDDLLFISVTDPFFNEFKEILELWEETHDNYDSLVVVRKCTDQLLSVNGDPLNFRYFGQPTQELDTLYYISMCAVITKRQTVFDHKHMIGSNRLFYVSKSLHMDVDYESDFMAASKLYEIYRGTSEFNHLYV
jgi:CMP-N-acetylneuraminic acid synthetase